MDRPVCPICDKIAIKTDDRFGGKYECPDHDLWCWGLGKPLRSRTEHARARAEFRSRGPRQKTQTSMTLDELVSDTLSWWNVLGVSPRASKAEIRQAYWRQAKTLHPDNGGNPEHFHALNEARDQALKGFD